MPGFFVMRLGVFVLLAGCIVASASSYAACANPTGDEGEILYNADFNVPQFCNGDDWIAFGQPRAGVVGTTCANPAGNEGEIIYNDASNKLQYCDGADWREAMGAATCDLSAVNTVLLNNPGVRYSEDTGNFYKQSSGATNYATALTNAASEMLEGVAGHLVTITSSAENTFVNSIRSGNVWIGADDLAVEGEWRWAAGPESGQLFWLGNGGGSSQNGFFENWTGPQPDDNPSEDAAGMWNAAEWNDFSAGTGMYYIIEWEGSAVLP